MPEIKLIQKFKKGKVYNTSDLIMPKHLYADFFENKDDIEEYEHHSCDICKVSFSITVLIKTESK